MTSLPDVRHTSAMTLFICSTLATGTTCPSCHTGAAFLSLSGHTNLCCPADTNTTHPVMQPAKTHNDSLLVWTHLVTNSY